MSAFEGQLHGEGQPGGGTPTRAEFIGGSLVVAATAARVPASRITVTPGGFNQDEVVLSWADGPREWALMVMAPDAKRALVAQAPQELSPQLRQWQRSVSFTRNFWLTVATGSGIATLALGIGIWQYDAVVAWTAAHLSAENERRLGRSVMNGVRREGHLVESGLALDTVRDIGARLTKDSTRKYEWYLKDDPSINAFALPGGFVVVHTGLVHAVGSADELAGVLAHEVQHVEQRHALQALLYQLGWASVLTAVLGDPGTATTLALLQVGNLKFSRDLETQADTLGVEALRRAGIPPESMAAFFRRMKEGTGGGAPPAWLSTHPDTGDRITAIEAMAAAPCFSCVPLSNDMAAVRESLYADGLMRRPAKKAPSP